MPGIGWDSGRAGRRQGLAVGVTLAWACFGSGVEATWLPGVKGPTARSAFAIAYDPIRGKTVMYGGTTGAGETWEYDALGWRQAQVSGPSSGFQSAMAWDGTAQEVVLFGGTGAAETWTYDGSAWTLLPISGPGGRSRHAMVWDAARSRIVLYGGNGGGALDDTWYFSGGAWSSGPQAPAGMVGRYEHAMAYDAARTEVVLFGGTRGSTGLKETWRLDGAGWSPGPAGPAGLTGRWGHSMAFDAAQQVVVLFGGANYNLPALRDTWEWDGSSWTAGSASPGTLLWRFDHGMVYDAVQQATVMFGGDATASQWQDDTWAYSAGGWAQAAGSTPRARHDHAMAYDPSRDRVVLFSGGETGPFRDNWIYSGTTWNPGPPLPSGMTYRWGSDMAFHAPLDVIVVFGGFDGVEQNDTWYLDATSWQSGAAAPPGLTGRRYHAMAGDPGRGVVTLFGGLGASTALNDVWELSPPGDWIPGLAAPAGLTPRFRSHMVYDPGRSRSVLFGGSDLSVEYSEVWEYDGAAWSRGIDPPATFPDRFGFGMAYQPTLARTLIFGGWDGGGPYLDDTWEFDGSAWSQIAPAPPWPAATYNTGMAPLPGQGIVLMFGGWLHNDAWEYDDCATILISPAVLPDGERGVAYTEMLSATGGAAPYAFTVSSGSLPPGLALDPSGLLSGTPTTPGSFNFEVTAQDAGGCSRSLDYSLQITCTVSVTPVTLPSGVVGSVYTEQLGANGVPPHQFTIGAGTVPAGLTLSSSGSLSGTPTMSGSYSFTVEVQDSQGCPGSRDYVLTIDCPSIGIAPPTLAPATQDVPYLESLVASGGTPPYGFAVASGALPPGLVLGGAGRLFGTPTASGSFTFGIAARDAYGCTGTTNLTLLVRGRWGVVLGAGMDQTNPNLASIFDSTGTEVLSLLTHGAGTWGTRVGAGDPNVDPADELLAGPGPGPIHGPQFRAFAASGASINKVNFYAYGTLRYGVGVAAAEIDADGFDELISGAGPGVVFGPHVRGFGFDATSITALPGINFFAYSSLRYGVNVTRGDLETAGVDRLLTGPGPGPVFAPLIRGWRVGGGPASAMARINFHAFSVLQFGAWVTAPDVEGDSFDEIAVGPGGGPLLSAEVAGFDYDGASVAALPGFQATPFTSLYGLHLGAAELTGDSSFDLLLGPGPDPSAPGTAEVWTYDGSSLGPIPVSMTMTPPASYGVQVAGGRFGQ